MSSKQRRRKQRKSNHKHDIKKSNTNINIKTYIDKFKMIEETVIMTDTEIMQLLLTGYIRQNTLNIHNIVPFDVELLCYTYFNDGKAIFDPIYTNISKVTTVVYEQPSTIVSKSKNEGRWTRKKKKRNKWKQQQQKSDINKRSSHDDNAKVTHCTLRFNKAFNALSSYEKRLICKTIIREKKWPIQELKVCINNEKDDEYKSVAKDFYFIEYILCNAYNTISTLDLSQIQWTDDHVLYFCNMIKNIYKYNMKRKRDNDKGIIIRAQNKNNESLSVKSLRTKPMYCSNGNMQKKGDKQLDGMRKLKLEKQQIVKNVVMSLEEINLSYNDITHKHLAFLLQIIKRYMPKMRELKLRKTSITNFALPVIIEHGLKRLTVDLTECKQITISGLNVFPRRCSNFDKPIKSYYCKEMVYFDNFFCKTNDNKSLLETIINSTGGNRKKDFKFYNKRFSGNASDFLKML